MTIIQVQNTTHIQKYGSQFKTQHIRGHYVRKLHLVSWHLNKFASAIAQSDKTNIKIIDLFISTI